MSWQEVAENPIVQRFGIALLGFAIAWIMFDRMNIHIDGRLASQDARIEDMRTENAFMREYIIEEQGQRKDFFTTIKEHLMGK
jgi:hypothetical protein|tara:strand:- start:502 stop:750 length:249 start_codon:yes stop_codon:yes gene_type:complete